MYEYIFKKNSTLKVLFFIFKYGLGSGRYVIRTLTSYFTNWKVCRFKWLNFRNNLLVISFVSITLSTSTYAIFWMVVPFWLVGNTWSECSSFVSYIRYQYSTLKWGLIIHFCSLKRTEVFWSILPPKLTAAHGFLFALCTIRFCHFGVWLCPLLHNDRFLELRFCGSMEIGAGSALSIKQVLIVYLFV
jgi:hypothetical protein